MAQRRASAPDAEALSLAWEAATGCDSIATIEGMYDRSPSGAYRCVYPGCSFARRDPEALWRHVHSGPGRNYLPPAGFDYGAYF
jgi:hypothetical protein